MISNELILDFFVTLSRAEYALKSAGYFRDNGSGAQPDWDRFARELIPHFNSQDSDELSQAVSYYLRLPPQKQIVEEGTLSWSDALPENGSEIERLLILVRRVRNNLFHGGKSNPQGSEEARRNTSLLSYGITILRKTVSLNDNVKREYDKAAF